MTTSSFVRTSIPWSSHFDRISTSVLRSVVLQGKPCPRGDACKYAHNDFEYWLHPARYKTEYCKQGPTCNRKICFFAHRPNELRKAPSVVYTSQGPFIDSETTARNKRRMQGAASTWNALSTRNSNSFNNAVFGDLNNNNNLFKERLAPSISAGLSPAAVATHLATASAQMGMTTSPTGSLLDFQTHNQESQGMNNFHSTLNLGAMPLQHSMSEFSPLKQSVSELSPLASQTPTTPWSTPTSFLSFNNPFSPAHTEQFTDTDLLNVLQGLQTQPLPQTPRSDTYPYSWSSELLNLVQMMSNSNKNDSGLCSSFSDGVIYGNQHLAPCVFTSPNALLSEQSPGRV